MQQACALRTGSPFHQRIRLGSGEVDVETIYDWLAIVTFAGLIVLFLQRSSMDEPPDTIWHYLPPAIGCALSNYLGNNDMGVAAILMLVAVGVYVALVLKPRLFR